MQKRKVKQKPHLYGIAVLTLALGLAGPVYAQQAALIPATGQVPYSQWTQEHFNGNCDISVCGENEDPDRDGLTNKQEYTLGTDPQNPDTDGDGLSDGDEVHIFATNPLMKSSVGDSRYSDSDYIRGGYLLAQGDLKMGDSEISAIAQKTETAGLHQPTPAALGYSLTFLYKLHVPKSIRVTLSDQTLRYFLGNYGIGSFLISSGTRTGPTPPGEYTVLEKRPVVNYTGKGYSYPKTKWNLLFKAQKGGSLYIHGAYWHHNFGHPMSHGCINVSYANMENLYNWADIGTPISIE